jgi:hypothetical protein
MKIACADALAALAREDVPDEVAAAYAGNRPFSGALHHPGAVRPAPDLGDVPSPSRRPRWKPAWPASPSRTSMPTAPAFGALAIRSPRPCSASTSASAVIPTRIVFAEGEEEQVIRAAYSFLREPAARHRHPARPRGPDPQTAKEAGVDSTGRVAKSSTPACRNNPASMPTISMSGFSAKATCSATASA